MSIKTAPGQTATAASTPPPSSLAGISIKRRQSTPSEGKRGDLTVRLAEAAADGEPAAPQPTALQPEAAPTAPEPDRAAPAAAANERALAPEPAAHAVAPVAVPVPEAVAQPRPVAAPLAPPPPAVVPTVAAVPSPSWPAPALPPKPPMADDIVAYWQGLRRGCSVPDLAALDRTTVAASWCNSLLLAFGPHDAASPSEPGATKITRLGDMTDDVEYTPMVIDSILSLGRRAVDHSIPLQEVLTFPLSNGMTRCRLVLLPLAGADGDVDHVLCQFSRAPTGPRLERRG